MRKKAVLLFSGGLDSLLVSYLAKKEGIDTFALYFHTVFSHHSKKEAEKKYASQLKNLGIPLRIIDFSFSHIKMVKKPFYGYGANLNPCIDCKIFMFNKAKEYMRKIGASFIITGEVLGERPMSQRRDVFNKIEKVTGLSGLILRPLSAKLLKQTFPEENNLIKQENLYSIAGRSRRSQFILAEKFGIKNFSTPSGGCLLTNPSFCQRLKDLLFYSPHISLCDCELLKIGRHFRLNSYTKIIVVRNKNEERRLKKFRKNVIRFYPYNTDGPYAIGRGRFNFPLIRKACLIISRYCRKENIPLVIKVKDNREYFVRIERVVSHKEIEKFLIGAK